MKTDKTIWIAVLVILVLGHFAWEPVLMGVLGHWDNGLMLVLFMLSMNPEDGMLTWKIWERIGLGENTLTIKASIIGLVFNSVTDGFGAALDFSNQGFLITAEATIGVMVSCLAIAGLAIAVYHIGRLRGLYKGATCDRPD